MSIFDSIKKAFNRTSTSISQPESSTIPAYIQKQLPESILETINKDAVSTSSQMINNNTKLTEIRYSDNSSFAFCTLAGPMGEYYSLLEKMRNEKNIYRKLELCGHSYQVLPSVIKEFRKEGFIPPSIPCRDEGPKLYIRTGQWEKAEEAVRICMKAKAYYPDDGKEVLKNIQQFCQVGRRIISYISSHPGCLQKDIYKATNISPEEKDQAKYFCKYSLQIRKEPYKNTNKLYVE